MYISGGCVWLLQVAAPAAPLQAEAAPGAHLYPGPGPPRHSRGPGSHSCQVSSSYSQDDDGFNMMSQGEDVP